MLTRSLKENVTATENLLKSLEQGQGAEIITERIARRQEERKDIEKRIAAEKLNNRRIDPDEIRFFLAALQKSDVNDLKYQQLLITVFVNSVYLYDDRLTILFNDSDTPVNVDLQHLNNASFRLRLSEELIISAEPIFGRLRAIEGNRKTKNRFALLY
jgi:hypothetical protein